MNFWRAQMLDSMWIYIYIYLHNYIYVYMYIYTCWILFFVRQMRFGRHGAVGNSWVRFH